MIELLDHHSDGVSRQIYDVFQASYAIEANLVGSSDFPPLRRKAQHIQSSKSQFLGEWIGAELASVVEYTLSGDDLSIDSLVVHPQYFRRGLASQLMQALLERERWQRAVVETAAANRPALDLYRKFGFTESTQWLTADGIEKVGLVCGSSAPIE